MEKKEREKKTGQILQCWVKNACLICSCWGMTVVEVQSLLVEAEALLSVYCWDITELNALEF